MILTSLGLIIFIVSIINLIRIGVFSVMSDIYDVKHHFRARKQRHYQPFISVIVPAHNERIVLERCLLSIYQSNYDNFEVIVVDDGSADTTARHGHYLRQKHRFAKLRVVRKRTNGGKASAINHGLKQYAKGELVVIMDADCILHPEALSRGGRYFKDSRINAVISNIKVINGSTPILASQLMEYMIAYRLKKAFSVANMEFLAGCTSFFRKKAVTKAGYYDEDTIAEDFDFSLKLIRKLGHSLYYADDVICYTEGAGNLKDLLNQRFRWRFGSFQAFYKNRSMFFSHKERLRILLTYCLLPWLLFCEFLFISEPILVATIIISALKSQQYLALWYGVFFYFSVLAVTVFADQHIGIGEKIKLILLSPFAYPLIMIINFVGYVSLLKSLVRVRRITDPSLMPSQGWVSPARTADR